jgi:hypothetical protein
MTARQKNPGNQLVLSRFPAGGGDLLNSIGIPPFLPLPMLDLRDSEPARRNRDISDKLPAIVTLAKNLSKREIFGFLPRGCGEKSLFLRDFSPGLISLANYRKSRDSAGQRRDL